MADPGLGRPPVFMADRASLQRDVVVLSGPEGRHAATVRRLRPGERADLIDGDGMIAECVVAAARPGLLELTVLPPAPNRRRSRGSAWCRPSPRAIAASRPWR